MSSEALDYGQDPEKIWKASLLKHQNEAYFALFQLGNVPKSWELMRGWIGCLSDASQKTLKDTVEELEEAIFNKQHIKATRTYQIFDEISRHVFAFYLTQTGFGLVQMGTLKKTLDAPSEKIDRRAKATIS